MLCPKCNSEMNENGVCPVCSQTEANTEATEEKKVEMPTSPVTKKEYIAKYASKKAKNSVLIMRVLAGVCALLFLIGGFITLNTAINEIPIVSLAFALSGDDISMDINADRIVDELEYNLDVYEERYSKKEEKMIEEYIEEVEKLGKNPSIANTKSFIEETLKLAEAEVGLSDYRFEDIKDDFNDPSFKILDILIAIVWIVAILFAGLALLAGLKFSSGLAILTIILNIIPGLCFAGFFHFLLVTAGLIAVVVVNSGFKGEFKAFNYNIKNS